ncbi:MAG: SURF1 family protein [Rhodocyclaceae bacterium]
MRVRRVVPLVVGLAMALLCARLGVWQWHRAAEKTALQACFDAAGSPLAVDRATDVAPWQRVELQGTWMNARTVYLDNRVRDQVAGFDVLTPLLLDHGKGIVIVDRGWIAGGSDRRQLPVVPTPDGEVVVTGLGMEPAHGFSLGESKDEPRVWQRIDPARAAQEIGQPVAPVYVRQESAAGDGLVRDWPRPDFGIDTHRGYAFQWFAFAAVLIGLTAWYGWKAVRKSSFKTGSIGGSRQT